MTIIVGMIVLVSLVLLWLGVIGPALQQRRAAKQAERLAETGWDVQEVHRGPMTYIEIIRPNCDPMQIGEGIPHSLPFAEYNAKVEDLWIEAEETADGKNRRLKA